MALWSVLCRNREGVQTTSIELAVKILTSEGRSTSLSREGGLLKCVLCVERIRNTLSHEMCHLACWIISNEPTENHGNIFKGW